MYRRTIAATVVLLAAATSHAALIDRGGGFIYDDVLNITWLRDANLGAGSAYDDGASTTDGRMTWASASAWAAALSITDTRPGAGGIIYDNWRLPTMGQPDPACSNQTYLGDEYPLQGSGYNCTNGEMARLFNITGISAAEPGPFTNLAANIYWSGAAYEPEHSPPNAWGFSFHDGYRHPRSIYLEYWAWAVRDGDVVVTPIPAAIWLFGGALGALGWVKRKQATA